MKYLVVIDMQKDFTTGVLGNPQTAGVVRNVVDKINEFKKNEPDGKIIATLDTHFDNYMSTQEGKNLPVPHCIKDTDGWQLEDDIKNALPSDAAIIEKLTFGSKKLPEYITSPDEVDEIQIIGVCTDICVISNAMILKAFYPEIPIKVISACCAGVTPESHKNALSAMKSCQIIVE